MRERWRRDPVIGVTEVTYYRWRQEFGGLKRDQVKRLKDRRRKIAEDVLADPRYFRRVHSRFRTGTRLNILRSQTTATRVIELVHNVIVDVDGPHVRLSPQAPVLKTDYARDGLGAARRRRRQSPAPGRPGGGDVPQCPGRRLVARGAADHTDSEGGRLMVLALDEPEPYGGPPDMPSHRLH